MAGKAARLIRVLCFPQARSSQRVAASSAYLQLLCNSFSVKICFSLAPTEVGEKLAHLKVARRPNANAAISNSKRNKEVAES